MASVTSPAFGRPRVFMQGGYDGSHENASFFGLKRLGENLQVGRRKGRFSTWNPNRTGKPVGRRGRKATGPDRSAGLPKQGSGRCCSSVAGWSP